MHSVDERRLDQDHPDVFEYVADGQGQLLAGPVLGKDPVLLQLDVGQIAGHHDADCREDLVLDLDDVAQRLLVVLAEQLLQGVVELAQALQRLETLVEVLEHLLQVLAHLVLLLEVGPVRVLGLVENELYARVGCGVVDGVEGVAAHDHLDGPLLLGRQPRGGHHSRIVHVPLVDEGARPGPRNACSHQVHLRLQVVIELDFLGDDQLALLYPLQQVVDIRVLSNGVAGPRGRDAQVG